ncbi:MAG: ATP-dependent helicase [Candidimonas sp.]
MTRSADAPRFVPSRLVPSDEQRAIQLSRHRITLVEANAGAAKTTTLALRIGEAIARGMPPEQILALVFTPEAKDVMHVRLRDVGIPYATVRRIHIQTVEEFAASMLERLDDGVRRIASRHGLKPYVLRAIERVGAQYAGRVDYLDIRTHAVAISQFLDGLALLKATMALRDDVEDLSLEEAARHMGVPVTDYLTALEYETRRLALGAAAFRGPQDAVYDLACRLSDDPDVRQAMPAYRLVVGDELHDMNEAAFRVFRALLDIEGLYFVGAGDKDQVIYAKLGADEKYMSHGLTQGRAHAARLPLTATYRHGPHLAYAIEAFKQKPVESSLPLLTEIQVCAYDDLDPDECGTRVVEAVQAWRRENASISGCAVLIRDRHQSVVVENALMHADIGYSAQGMSSYLQREEILFLRGMMAIALSNLGAVASQDVRKAVVEALALYGEIALTPRELEQAKNDIAKDPANLGSFFSGHIQRHAEDRTKSRIADAVGFMQSVDAGAPAARTLTEVCRRLDLATLAQRIYIDPYDASVIARSVQGFIDIAEKRGLDLRAFAEWIAAAEGFADGKRGKTLVVLACVENVKGREYDHVILPFLERGEFPSRMRSGRQEENLFYVAVTRARKKLTLVAPADPQRRSPYISALRLSATRSRANMALERNQRQAPSQARARIDLNVPYSDKDVVKALGARWDSARKVWYISPAQNPKDFAPWIANRS